MLDKSKWTQYGVKRTENIKGITIHNTGNDKSAEEHLNLMAASSQHFATHFFVDEKKTIQVMPLNWAVWHTGKGFDMGNMRTIAIEICRSTSDQETYLKAQARAIKLIRKLMEEHNISAKDIYFHNDFNNTYCPHRLLDIYKTKENFIRKELDL